MRRPDVARRPRHQQARRTLVITALGIVLGIVGGAAAWLLLHLIGLITNLALFHRWGWSLPSFANFHPDGTLVVAAVLGGLVVALLARWAPVIRGHGIPEAMESVLVRQSRIAPPAAIAKPASAAVAIGTGGPFGAEGPIIVTGGAFGSLLGQWLRVTPSERKVLLAAGAAAGMSATFGAPLAAVVLAVELLTFEFSSRTLVPLLAASSVAGAMHVALFGAGPLFSVPAHADAGLESLPVFAVVGVLCGLLAVVICKGLFVVEHVFRRLPVSDFWHPMLGALVFATIGLAVPRALGVGYDAIDDVLANRIALGALAVLMLGKLVIWWIALGSGTSGGTLAPILLISGAFGGLLGAAIDELLPGLHIAPGVVALVAMAATFGASTRAVFTAVVFAFELTHDFASILPIMLAAVIADLVAGALLDHGLMTEKLARRGLRVSRDYAPDELSVALVRDHMTSPVVTVREDASVDDTRTAIVAFAHRAFPIVDAQDRCVGVVTRDDLLGPDSCAGDPVVSVGSRDVIAVVPEDTLLTVLERMLDEHVDHVPVLDDAQRVVGICTRTDVLRVRDGRREAELPQPGWHHALRLRRQSSNSHAPTRAQDAPRVTQARGSDRALADGDYQALARFRYALRVFQRFSEQAARDAGTTPAQHQLLLAVRGHGGTGAPAVSDLAESLQLKHHSAVELIDRADAAGLVRRRVDPADQRRQLVLLTAKGSALLERLSRVHRDELRRFRVEMTDVLRELD